MKFRLIHADVLDGLRSLADESVQCAVTSPPYWGLRDYGTATWSGGDADCDHKAGSDYGAKSDTNVGAIRGGPFRGACGKCGGIRIDQQLGLERTPDEYVARMVAVFREVRRVLRSDGTLWLNIGDTYSAAKGQAVGSDPKRGRVTRIRNLRPNDVRTEGYKPKDLIGVPWMLAFALRADGWYLRSDIIWSKPNPMPESVTDRPTKAHEYLFLLTKSARYFYDADAIKEDSITGDPRAPYTSEGAWQLDGRTVEQRNGGKVRTKKPDGWATHDGGHGSFHRDGREKGEAADVDPFTKRNRRSVWTIATEPFPEAHFATFPTALVEPCILAGSRIGDTILDPFNGSGTTGVVALSHQRDYIGIELNADYVAMARRRLQAVAPMFTTEVDESEPAEAVD